MSDEAREAQDAYDASLPDDDGLLKPEQDRRIAEIAGRVEAASDAPWGYKRGSIAWMIRERKDGPQVGNTILEEDADFIAHARTDIPFLLAQLAAATERAERTGGVLYAICELLISEKPGATALAVDAWSTAGLLSEASDRALAKSLSRDTL